MKRTIQLRESDIRRMVMEAVRRINEDGEAQYINQDYDSFDQEAFDAEGDVKRAQENDAWRLYTDPKYAQTNDGIEKYIGSGDNGLFDYNRNINPHSYSWPSLDAQGSPDSLKDTLFAQERRCSTTDSVEAGRKNWSGGGLPGEEEFNDDGPLPIIGQFPNYNGCVATRNPNYPEWYDHPLDESLNRVVRKVIKRRLR